MSDPETTALRVRLARRVATFTLSLGASPVVFMVWQVRSGPWTMQLAAGACVVTLTLAAVCAFARLSPRVQGLILLGALLQVPLLTSLLCGMTPGLAGGAAVVWMLSACLLGPRAAMWLGAFLVSWLFGMAWLHGAFPTLLSRSDAFVDVRTWQNWARTSLTMSVLTAVVVPAMVCHLRALRDAARASARLLDQAHWEEFRRSAARAAQARAESERRDAAGLVLLDLVGAGIARRCGDLLQAIGAEVERLHLRSAGADAMEIEAVRDMKDSVSDAAAVMLRLVPSSPDGGAAPALDLAELVTSARRQLRKVPGVDLVVHAEPGLRARIGPSLIHGVLFNLVLNARDAMPHGGTVTLTARRATRAEANATGCACAIDVADTGSGMDDATLACLFHPFFTTKGAAGTGIGLKAARRALEKSGGRIQVASALGCGTTFTLLLPAAPSRPATVRYAASSAGTSVHVA
jgi:signal transduction histidine kinase